MIALHAPEAFRPNVIFPNVSVRPVHNDWHSRQLFRSKTGQQLIRVDVRYAVALIGPDAQDCPAMMVAAVVMWWRHRLN